MSRLLHRRPPFAILEAAMFSNLRPPRDPKLKEIGNLSAIKKFERHIEQDGELNKEYVAFRIQKKKAQLHRFTKALF